MKRIALLVFTALVALTPVAAAQVRTDSAAGGARPLSLEEAVSRALDESEAVGIAEAGVLDARGRQSQARSGYFPQLAGSAAYQRTLASQFSGLQSDEDEEPVDPAPSFCEEFVPDPSLPVDQRIDALEQTVECLSTVNPFAAFSDLPFGRENQWSFGLSLTQNLFTGGRLRAQNRIAGATRRSAEIEVDAQEAQALLDVVQAYYDAALAQRLVAIAETSLTQAERTLGETRLAFEVGTAAEFDLLRAQVSRDNLRPTLIQSAADRRVAELRLKQLLDLPLADSLVLTTSLGDTTEMDTTAVPELPPAIQAVATEAAEAEERAAVRQAAEAVTASEGAVTVAGSQRWPTLTLSSQYARIGFPDRIFPEAWNQFVDDWTLTVQATLPIFTGGRIKGDRMVAEAGLDQARLRLRQTQELAAIDEQSTQAQLEAAQAAWEASTGTVAQARRAYDIAEVRYRNGLSTQTELSESRLLLQQARTNRARAARDLQVARTRMALLPLLPLGAGGQGG
ncbi:MAG: TolC family protein, partial [Gemmatimonadota bacterium]|nr:TolC family protein [Gemmatimonadota bacterium]